MDNMIEEERKRYLHILIENLYGDLKIVSESTVQNKEKVIDDLIEKFYKENKEEYKIENISEVKEILCEIGKKVKEANNSRESEER